MKITRKMITGGLASFAVIAGIVVGPMSISSHALSLEDVKQPQKLLKLKTKGNSGVDVSTELDCSTHTLTAKVTNKTKQAIHPNVTFNTEEPTVPSALPVEPGKTANYFYTYSGNNMLVNVGVSGDSFSRVETSPTLYCLEPVSFKATEWSSSAVVGTLSNNSTLVPQTVYTQANNGEVRLETLQPGESRLIALPYHGVSGQTSTMVKVATSAGYESSYSIDIDKPALPPIPVLR